MFPVILVPDQAANLYEQLGTKPKFWFSSEESVVCLFKEVQKNTGEDWSEKVASELCELLGLPHAEYELAIWRGKRGVVSPTFVPRDGRLVLGNELLARIHSGYPARKFFRVSQHTLRRVLTIIRQDIIGLPIGMSGFPGVETAVHVFVGYLMLDADCEPRPTSRELGFDCNSKWRRTSRTDLRPCFEPRKERNGRGA